jgi:2-polyprenyl-6-methoxyphenol hydroxylase-like FAD-dependent oxidoreductase
MRIGVIGCGTAGPALAVIMARAGHDVLVMERFAAPKPVGAGLLIQPSGQAILDDLGLLGTVWSQGEPVRRLRGCDSSRRVVMDLSYADAGEGRVGLGIGRGALFGALLAAAEGSGARLAYGEECVGITQDGPGGTVRVRTATGGEHGPFDMVAVADGARSTLRPAHLVRRATMYPWGAMWCSCAKPDGSYDGVLEQTYRDTREMLGFLPTGLGRLAMFWSVRGDMAGVVRGRPIEEWKAAVARLSARAEPLLAQVTSWDDVAYGPYYDTVMSRWHDGRVVYIGDAGHAMSPQLGMGANLALVDAAVLAACVKAEGRGPGRGNADVPRALAAYSRARRSQLRYYQAVSRLLTPWFQSSQWWRAPIRNVAFPLAARVGPIRRQMLAGLVGAKQGWLRSEMPRVVGVESGGARRATAGSTARSVVAEG